MNQDSSASILQNGKMFDRQTKKKYWRLKLQLKAWYGAPYCTDIIDITPSKRGRKIKEKLSCGPPNASR